MKKRKKICILNYKNSILNLQDDRMIVVITSNVIMACCLLETESDEFLPNDSYRPGREPSSRPLPLKLWDIPSLRTSAEFTGDTDVSVTLHWDSSLDFSLVDFLFLENKKLETFPLNDNLILFDFVTTLEPCAWPASWSIQLWA